MHVFEASRCRTCGTRREEWDPDAGGHPHAYIAATTRCRGCEEIEKKRSSLESDQVSRALLGKGVYVVLKPNPNL